MIHCYPIEFVLHTELQYYLFQLIQKLIIIFKKNKEELNMEILNEVRKEDDLYYTGAFWIIADAFTDIIRGNFRIIGNKILTDMQVTISNVSYQNAV